MRPAPHQVHELICPDSLGKCTAEQKARDRCSLTAKMSRRLDRAHPLPEIFRASPPLPAAFFCSKPQVQGPGLPVSDEALTLAAALSALDSLTR
jgi:hypothetical protein